MPTELYLDSARLGLMPPRARRAQHDFVRLVGREGASAAVIDLLRGGFDRWPRELRCRYPDLCDWRGIDPFLQAIRVLAGAQPASEVFLASHSAPLMELAACLLCHACRVILHTDLEWPPYVEILRTEAKRRGRRMVCVPVREVLFGGCVESSELIERLARAYRRSGADGLFLTEVTYGGIRLPVTRLAASLATTRVPRFVVVDAAQALGHTPIDLSSGPGDLYLAGCHKWIGSGLPLSVAIAPRCHSWGLLREIVESLQGAPRVDDPLLRFSRTLTAGVFERQGETVNLAPLFPASAAVSVQLDRADSAGCRYEQRIKNRSVLTQAVRETGWQSFVTHVDHQSGILLIQSSNDLARGADPDSLRGCFRKHGVALTAYQGGVVRASLPDVEWTNERLLTVIAAFHRVRMELTGRDSRPLPGAPEVFQPAGPRATLRLDGIVGRNESPH